VPTKEISIATAGNVRYVSRVVYQNMVRIQI